MSLNVSKVWLVTEGGEVLVNSDQIKPGDEVKIHMGTVIPFDGIVTAGEGMVNQASLTGESMPVAENAKQAMHMQELLLRKVRSPSVSKKHPVPPSLRRLLP